VPKINLFSCYFKVKKDPERQWELDYCMDHNKANKLIDQIFTFDGRPTYDDFFVQAREFPDDINIFANADIFFNETLTYTRFLTENRCFAITRWEQMEADKIIKFEERNNDNRFAQAQHSQDVWMFKGRIRDVKGYFYSGIPGCDNRIAAELQFHYQVLNPCETIQCIHVHKNPVRKYNIPEGEVHQVPRPWKWIPPCSISETGAINVTKFQDIKAMYKRTNKPRGAV